MSMIACLYSNHNNMSIQTHYIALRYISKAWQFGYIPTIIAIDYEGMMYIY